MRSLPLLIAAALLLSGCPKSGPGGTGTDPRRARRDPLRPVRRATPGEAEFNRGIAALKKKPAPQFEAALAAFKQAGAKLPKSAAVWANLGYCHLHLSQLAKARAAFSTAMELAPGKRAVVLGMVDVLLRSGTPKPAILLLSKLRKANPKDLLVLDFSAAAHRANKEPKRSLSMVQDAMVIDRKHAVAYVNWGMLYLDKGDARTALMIINRGLRHQRKNAALFFARGQAWMSQNKMGRAVMDFTRASLKDKGHVAARLNLGKIYVDNLDYKGALAHFDAVLRLWPRNRDALLGRARALFGLKLFPKSMAGYETVIKHHGKLPVAIFQVAKIFESHLEKPCKAIKYYRVFLKITPSLSKRDPVYATLKMLVGTNPKCQPAPRRPPVRKASPSAARPPAGPGAKPDDPRPPARRDAKPPARRGAGG